MEVTPDGAIPGSSVTVNAYNLPSNTSVDFAILGFGVSDSLSPTSCSIQGTSSSISDRQTNDNGELECIIPIPETAGTGDYAFIVFYDEKTVTDTLLILQSDEGTFTLNVEPTSVIMPPPASGLTFSTQEIIDEQILITYSKLGTFDETVTVTFDSLPFGVSAFKQFEDSEGTDTDGSFVAFTSQTLDSPADKLNIRFVPSLFADIGFQSATLQAESNTSNELLFEEIDILIPTPTEYSGLDYFGDGEFFEGTSNIVLIGNKQFIQSGDIVNISGFISTGGTCSFVDESVTTTLFDSESGNSISISQISSITIDSSCQFEGQIQIPFGLSPHNYDVDVFTTISSIFMGTNINIVDDTISFVVDSPDQSPFFEAGTSSSVIPIIVDVLPGQDLSECGGSATVQIFGLPPDVVGSLDGEASSQFPSKSIVVSAGGATQTELVLTSSVNAFPGFFSVFADVTCGSEFSSGFTDTGISFDDDFFLFDDGFLNYDYFGGIVTLTGSAPNVGGSLTVDAQGFTPGENVIIRIFSFQITDSCLDIGVTEGCTQIIIPNGFVSDGSTGTWDGTVPLPDEITIPGTYEIDISDESGTTGFSEFTVIDTTDSFTITTTPNYLGFIEKPTSGTVTSDPITITLKSTNGQNSGGVDLEFAGVPPGVTPKIDGVAVMNGIVNDIQLEIGSTKTLKLEYDLDTTVFPGPGIVDIIATANNSPSIQKVAFADFEIVTSSLSFTQFGFGTVSVPPQSVEPGDTIEIIMSGFEANDPVFLSLGFDSDGDLFTVSFPSGQNTFDSTGFKQTEITIPPFCTSFGTFGVNDGCLAGPGFYPIFVDDDSNTSGFAEFDVVSPTDTLEIIPSPSPMAGIEQGTLNDDVADLKINLNALPGRDPGSTTLSMFWYSFRHFCICQY